MQRLFPGVAVVLTAIFGSGAAAAEPARRSPKEALQSFNDLIGSWRAAGAPEGTREERAKGFWTEEIQWEWQFKGDDVWLRAAWEKGKYFVKGEMRYLAEKDLFRFSVETTDKQTLTFEGELKNDRVLLERTDEAKKETQRLVFSLLHSNRYLYSYEVKPAERKSFSRVYQVGCTKEGVAFASGDTGPECVVSGGLGTMQVTYKGQTYYVCCGGCRDAFKDNPEKFIKEYEARKAKKEKK